MTCRCLNPAVFGHQECADAPEWSRDAARAGQIEERLDAAHLAAPGWRERNQAEVAYEYAQAEQDPCRQRERRITATYAEQPVPRLAAAPGPARERLRRKIRTGRYR